VDIDKARQNRKPAPVDLDRVALFGRTSRADCGDRVAFDRHVDVPAIAMGLRRFVPGDEPGGVANDFPRRGGFERIGHGISSKQSPLRSANPGCRAAGPGVKLRLDGGLGSDPSLSRRRG